MSLESVFTLEDRAITVDSNTALSDCITRAGAIPWNGPITLPLSKISIPTGQNVAVHLLFAQEDIQRISKSIATIGLTAPLFVVRNENDTYGLVSGIKRIVALQDKGVQTVPAYSIAHEVVTPFQLFCFRTLENSGHRPLSVFEKAIILNTFSRQGTPPAHNIQLLSSLLEIPPKKDYLLCLERIIHLPKVALQMLASDDITLTQVLELTRLTIPEQSVALELIQHSKWNNKEFSQVLLLLQEIADRDRCQMTEVLTRTGIFEVLGDKKLNRRERGNKIRQGLLRERYPVKAQHEAQFLTELKKLRLPPSIRVQAPPQFEGNELRVIITEKNEKQFQQALAKLYQLSIKGKFQALFDYF